MKNREKEYNPIKVVSIMIVWFFLSLFLLSTGLNLTNKPDDLALAAGIVVLTAIPVTTFFTFKYLNKNFK